MHTVYRILKRNALPAGFAYIFCFVQLAFLQSQYSVLGDLQKHGAECERRRVG